MQGQRKAYALCTMVQGRTEPHQAVVMHVKMPMDVVMIITSFATAACTTGSCAHALWLGSGTSIRTPTAARNGMDHTCKVRDDMLSYEGHHIPWVASLVGVVHRLVSLAGQVRE